MRNILILTFSPALFFLIYDVVFYYIPLVRVGYDNIEGVVFFVMIASDILAVICLFFTAGWLLVFSKNKRVLDAPHNGVSGWCYVLLCVLVFFVFNYLVYSVFGSISYGEVVGDFSRFYALTKRGTAWIFIFLCAVIFMMLFDIYISGASKIKSVCFFLILALVALTGGRSFIIVAALFYFYIRVVVWHADFGFSRVLLFVIFSSVVFVGGAVLRAGDFESYVNSSASLDFDAAFILDDAILHAENHGFNYFLSLEDYYNTFVPRYFNEDKPMSTAETRLVYPDVAGRGTNYTFGIYANAFLNFGYLGFLVVPVYVLVSSLFFLYFSVSKARGYLSFAAIFFLFYSLQFVRGGVVNSRLVFIFISLLVGWGVYFLFRWLSLVKWRRL